MIVVDSSAFIEYYRPSGNPELQNAVLEVIQKDIVAVNGIIQVEIVAFAATVAEYEKLRIDFKAFHWLNLTHKEFDLAAELGNTLRRKGITIPPTDLVISASAINAKAVLYHTDAHFDAVAGHTELKAENLLS